MTWVAMKTFGFIHVRGADVTAFLQGQLTCDVNRLSKNQAAFTGLCDHKGRVLANFLMGPWEDGYWLWLPSEMVEPTLEHLKKYALFSKVELNPVEQPWETRYYNLSDVDQNETLFHEASEQAFAITHHQHTLLIHLPGKSSRWLVMADSKAMEAFHLSLPSNIKKGSIEEWHYDNIHSGIAFIDLATRGLFTPQMINLQKFGGVSFSKGCFVGQEIIARTEHLGQLKRHLYRADYPHAKRPEIGATITDQQLQPLGVVAEVSQSADGGFLILAVIQDRALANNAMSLVIEGCELSAITQA